MTIQSTQRSKLSRRDFIKASAAGFGSLVIATVLPGCGDNNLPVVVTQPDPTGAFNHGVASGDPLQDKVILWTRITPNDNAVADVTVNWEVASDEAFSQMIAQGSTNTSSAVDFTVKIDLQGLTANTVYYYRFGALGAVSAVGRTKTLPADTVSAVKMAIVSCANYPAGHFNVYNELGHRDDLDVVLHLGDYIYEYGMGGFGTDTAEQIGRTLPANNADEIFTLADYRLRYGLYHSDHGLQHAHRQVPFIAVWDDHEIANDSYVDGAENHNEGEGDFSSRKQAALQAYFEWIPIRPAAVDDNQTIFRQFDFANLVSLYMLDTRHLARDRPFNYTEFFDPATGAFNNDVFIAAIADPTRTMLGLEQLQWLQGRMQQSTATWQVLGQQVLMGRMLLPAEILPFLNSPGPEVVNLLNELANIKQRIKLNDPTVTPEQRARVETLAPYNLDAWDGYVVEREIILGTAKALGKNLVVVAGDTHNAWANNLATLQGDAVGVEFAVASVTSPGFGDFLGLNSDTFGGFEAIIRLLIDDLKYFNSGDRGYMVMTFTETDAIADWHYVDNISSTTYSELTGRHHRLRMRAGQPVLAPAN